MWVINMNMILTTVLQEKRRIEYMLEKYGKEYERLPKGTISERTVNGKTYFYLKYRDGKKVVSKYIAKDGVEKLRERIEKRKHIEAMIKSLKEELAIANRVTSYFINVYGNDNNFLYLNFVLKRT